MTYYRKQYPQDKEETPDLYAEDETEEPIEEEVFMPEEDMPEIELDETPSEETIVEDIISEDDENEISTQEPEENSQIYNILEDEESYSDNEPEVYRLNLKLIIL